MTEVANPDREESENLDWQITQRTVEVAQSRAEVRPSFTFRLPLF